MAKKIQWFVIVRISNESEIRYRVESKSFTNAVRKALESCCESSKLRYKTISSFGNVTGIDNKDGIRVIATTLCGDEIEFLSNKPQIPFLS